MLKIQVAHAPDQAAVPRALRLGVAREAAAVDIDAARAVAAHSGHGAPNTKKTVSPDK
jgi:hypothetical protein